MVRRVLLADDHRVLREGLRSLLERERDLQVVGETADGHQTVRSARELLPDVVVMDVGMPGLNGIEATRQVRATCRDVQVLGLSTHSDRRYVLAMLEAGARGYLLKSSASEELVRAIRAVALGQHYLGPEVAGAVVDCYVDRSFPTERSAFDLLGDREREVLQLLAEGATSRGISGRLHISVKTVETHRRNIMKKLDLHSVATLTKYAIREGLTSLDT